ncbi:MAG TPA: hypothetical protein VHY75_02945 [Steroidobacteraceae bacterium]|jgi:hypothetical protein|nr:hypothetical protein [Steroidobacteraceae bacterium]
MARSGIDLMDLQPSQSEALTPNELVERLLELMARSETPNELVERLLELMARPEAQKEADKRARELIARPEAPKEVVERALKLIVQPATYRVQQPLREALTPKELFDRVLKFANHPTADNWYGLAPESLAYVASLPTEIASVAGQLQAALSIIARKAHTSKEIKAWKAATAGMRILPDFIVEGRKVSTKLTWWVMPPPKALNWAHVRPEGWNQLFTVDRGAILATAIMLLLDPAQNFGELHECGRGPDCNLERFHLQKRKYCCDKHWPDRKTAHREREKVKKAVKKVAKQIGSVASAKRLVSEVKGPGLKQKDLVQQALAKWNAEKQPSTGRRISR